MKQRQRKDEHLAGTLSLHFSKKGLMNVNLNTEKILALDFTGFVKNGLCAV